MYRMMPSRAACWAVPAVLWLHHNVNSLLCSAQLFAKRGGVQLLCVGSWPGRNTADTCENGDVGIGNGFC